MPLKSTTQLNQRIHLEVWRFSHGLQLSKDTSRPQACHVWTNQPSRTKPLETWKTSRWLKQVHIASASHAAAIIHQAGKKDYPSPRFNQSRQDTRGERASVSLKSSDPDVNVVREWTVIGREPRQRVLGGKMGLSSGLNKFSKQSKKEPLRNRRWGSRSCSPLSDANLQTNEQHKEIYNVSS